ncbi:MAG: pyridoxal phosphate-dependent aminotransferase, partial [Gemmatimonadota bacterium]
PTMTVRIVEHPNLIGVTESETLAMTRRAAEIDSPDHPVISLSAGEPDFPTPAYIAEAGIAAIRAGRTRYPPAAGLAPLRAAIASYLEESCGGDWTPEQVIVSVGAKQALFDAIFTLFGPGDRVAIPAPYWVSYPPMVRLARAEPVIVPTRVEDGFRPLPEQVEGAFEEGARGLILNSPGNPTGAMLTESDVAALVELAAAYDAWIVSDEIYNEIRYVDGFASVSPHARDYERIVLVNGFSKAFSMTGWRVGYAAAPVDLVKAMTGLQGHINTNTALPAQYAALAALTDEDARRSAISPMVEAFARRRLTLLEGLARIPGLAAFPPLGAFYVWVDARAWCRAAAMTSAELCFDLLDHERLALVPGAAFGGEEYLRISFAASDEALAEALKRLGAAADRLGIER